MATPIDSKYRKILKPLCENTDWFDENFLEIAAKIKYTPFALSETEWNDIYEKTKDDEKILWFVIKNKECPYDIIKKVANAPTTNLFTDQILSLEILQDDEINILINRQGKPHIEELLTSVIPSGKCPYSKSVIEYMIKNRKSYGYAELAYTDDIQHIKNVMQENEENEKVMLMIANNKHMPDNIRNTAYDNCDWNNVYFQTDYMNKTIYQGIAQTVFEINNDEETEKVWSDTYSLLLKKIKDGQVPESCQVDLIHRSPSLPKSFQNEILSTIAWDTKSKFVLDIIWETGDKEIQRIVANNKESSNENKLKFIEDILDEKYSKVNSGIVNVIQNAQIPNELYEKIFNANDPMYFNAIITSSKTPMNILEEIKERYSEYADFANIALFCRQNGISKYQESIEKSVTQYINKKKVIPLLANPLNEKYNEFAPFFNGIEIKNKDESIYVSSIVDEMIKTSADKLTIKALDFYKQCLDRYTKQHFALLGANKLFAIKRDEDGKRLVNVAHYSTIRNEKEDDIKKQISILDAGLLAKIQKIIEHNCHSYASIYYGNEPRDLVEAHLSIEGYADVYNLIDEEIRSRMIKEFDERVDDDGFEK